MSLTHSVKSNTPLTGLRYPVISFPDVSHSLCPQAFKLICNIIGSVFSTAAWMYTDESIGLYDISYTLVANTFEDSIPILLRE